MSDITIEQANYIMENYSNLLPLKERVALMNSRMANVSDSLVRLTKTIAFSRYGWISNDPEILNHINPDYVQSIVAAASNLLEEKGSEIFLNLCLVCKKLARTPLAKQCRLCGHDWHYTV